jgi:hypothetical protein
MRSRFKTLEAGARFLKIYEQVQQILGSSDCEQNVVNTSLSVTTVNALWELYTFALARSAMHANLLLGHIRVATGRVRHAVVAVEAERANQKTRHTKLRLTQNAPAVAVISLKRRCEARRCPIVLPPKPVSAYILTRAYS